MARDHTGPVPGTRTGRPGHATQHIGRGTQDHGGDQRRRPVGQAEGKGQSHGECEGRARVQGQGAGRGVQRGPAALFACLLAQFVPYGLTRHLCQLVNQMLVQMLQVIHRLHTRPGTLAPRRVTRLVLMEILGATLRVCVDDLETAIPFYERLAGGSAQRFERGGVEVAAIGCFLLMSGPPAELEVLRKVSATIAVKDVDDTHRVLTELGAHIVAGPIASPAGRNLIALHPDGSIYEYVDRNA